MAKKSFISFEFKGLKEVLKGIDRLEKNIVENVDAELEASSSTIAKNARRLAPIDTGALRGSISAFKDGQLSYEVVAQKNYAPYLEFGTGGLVDVPAGLEDYAIQFKGEGIKQVNIPARPYLFPAYEAERKDLLERLRKQLIKKSLRGITVIKPGDFGTTGDITTI